MGTEDQASLEITHYVVTGRAEFEEDPELALPPEEGLEKRSSFESSSVRNAFKQVSQSFKRLAYSLSLSKRQNQDRSCDRTMSAAARALRGLKFIGKKDVAAEWLAVENRFDNLTANTGDLLRRDQFGECIGMIQKNKESGEFFGDLFDALCRRRDIAGDWINKAQLKEFWGQISDQSFESRLKTFFDMFDKDADGKITKEEVREIISVSASANKLSNIQKRADEFAALIMRELDTDNLGYIKIDSLEMVLLQAPSHSTGGGESRNLSQMLSEKLKTQEPNPLKRWYRETNFFLLDNWQRVWVVTLWIGVMLGLFAWKFLQYRKRAAVYDVMGHCVCMAKGAAETLKLNMALILLPVCRNTITWLRNNTKLGVAVPFDDNINFHQVIAVAIAIGVGIHGVYHLGCDFPRLLDANPAKYKPMEQYFGKQPSSYWHFAKSFESVSGIIMVALMAIAFTLATPWFRRVNSPKGLKKLTGFNAFWYTHHLFVAVYALLIAHGIKLYLTREWYQETTWMYLAAPIVLYACERLIRAFRSSIEPVKILKADYPGHVLELHMSKPPGFKYKSGQYMFVNCAAVSAFEWHPFSITTAPEDDYLSVHIRTLGDWTRQLEIVFSKVSQPPPSGKSEELRADCLQEKNIPNFPRVLIDGPYGAPAQDYKMYEVVLLVGLGIGATPMISIVKDIANNMKAKKEEEGECALESEKRKSGVSGSGCGFRTRKAYFYWVTKEQCSFDWFKGIVNEVAEMDHRRVIEMHNYCTSVYEEGDARSAIITMIQSLNHAKNGVDIVSGTCVKSHFAKPNWPDVYNRIALNHTDSRVGVFYCGLPAPVKELRQLALDFSHTTSTKFEFHKENF